MVNSSRSKYGSTITNVVSCSVITCSAEFIVHCKGIVHVTAVHVIYHTLFKMAGHFQLLHRFLSTVMVVEIGLELVAREIDEY